MTTEEHEEKLKENDRDYVFDLKDYKLYIDAKDDIQCVGHYLSECDSNKPNARAKVFTEKARGKQIMIVCEKTVEIGEEILFDYRDTELPQRKTNEQKNRTNNPQISSESELNEILTTSTPINPSPFLEDSEPVHTSAREYTGPL